MEVFVEGMSLCARRVVRDHGQGAFLGDAPLAEPLAALVAGLAGYTHILAPATTFGENLAPSSAALSTMS